MRRWIILLALACSCLYIHSCCTKAECLSVIQPSMIVYFPEASKPQPTVWLIRMEAATSRVVDSSTGRAYDRSLVFNPWTEFHEGEWKDYNYIISLDEPGFRDTVYGISYDKVEEEVSCNTCFPPSDKGKSKFTSYANLRFYHQGKELRRGDTVFMVKR